nr:immunoglobulin heavy chain junction region [Macaca mulatta]MOW93779.1 immunoglobulin heavy chain junction region [Macaca mulatta]MOW94233.1 immunoglobulin heavy chain junction region [Macaca mulatta]MOW94598.1 immunoglobulin heavy chain junction region [Macaca mulatta]MOW94692.1 immunoglobulin heavy chain junction region [Macaca mulatta]
CARHIPLRGFTNYYFDYW